MGGKKSGAAAAAAAPVEPRRRGRKRKAVSYFEESGDLDYTAIKKMKATKVVEDYEDDEFAEEAPVKPKKAGKEKVVSSVGLTIQETVEAAPAKVALLSTKKTITAAVDLTGEETGRAGPAKQVQATSKAAVAHPILPPVGEKRLKRWRDKAPQSYMTIHDRAMTQRMFVVDRTRSGDDNCPTETMTIAGTTGNLYTIKIEEVPSCNCPHAKKGNQCKHIVYAMCRVLHAPHHLQYQLALVPSELRQIFAQAPPIPSVDAEKTDNNRKPVSSEEDCPICCMPFEPEKEEIVYCKAACGNNIHAECFNTWAATKKRDYTTVTCPFCRTPWQEGDVSKAVAGGTVNSEGYVNVASQLGLDGRRDYSTYHTFWVNKQRRRGVDTGGRFYYGEWTPYD